MELAVLLALIVLAASFCILLSSLIVMWKRRRDYELFTARQAIEVTGQDWQTLLNLAPKIKEQVNGRDEKGDANVAVTSALILVKHCYDLGIIYSKVPLNACLPSYSQAIITTTSRLVVACEKILDVLNAPIISMDTLEAYSLACVSCAYALTVPFTLLYPISKLQIADIISEMDSQVAKIFKFNSEADLEVDLVPVSKDKVIVSNEKDGESSDSCDYSSEETLVDPVDDNVNDSNGYKAVPTSDKLHPLQIENDEVQINDSIEKKLTPKKLAFPSSIEEITSSPTKESTQERGAILLPLIETTTAERDVLPKKGLSPNTGSTTEITALLVPESDEERPEEEQPLNKSPKT
uniref:Transmembrane protein 98 n=1 Tax=Rhabditophanes sp. KR3021 TaxID=114890 RepID=A0AC35TTA3_9BILA